MTSGWYICQGIDCVFYDHCLPPPLKIFQKLSILNIYNRATCENSSKKVINTLHQYLRIKNKAATFALPNGNNGSENDRDHEF